MNKDDEMTFFPITDSYSKGVEDADYLAGFFERLCGTGMSVENAVQILLNKMVLENEYKISLLTSEREKESQNKEKV